MIEISEKVRKSLMTPLRAGRQGLSKDYTDYKHTEIKEKSVQWREHRGVLRSFLDIQWAMRRGGVRDGSASFFPTQSQRFILADILILCFHGRLTLALIENGYLPRKNHNPIATKASAATFLRIF